MSEEAAIAMLSATEMPHPWESGLSSAICRRSDMEIGMIQHPPCCSFQLEAWTIRLNTVISC